MGPCIGLNWPTAIESIFESIFSVLGRTVAPADLI